MVRIGMVSSVRPETNYTAYLIEALQEDYSDRAAVFVYCEKDEGNREAGLKNLRLCWDRNWRYLFQILTQAKKDHLQVLHFQHEINMFGGPRTAVLFPLLVFLSRVFGFKPVVTIHAVVPTSQLNQEFLKVFEWPKPALLAPVVKVVFPAIYFFIGLFSRKVIVHSPGLRGVLVRDYFVKKEKIVVIPHGVPEKITCDLEKVDSRLKELVGERRFILYFGYFHRRKGLEVLIRAFSGISKVHENVFLVLAGGTILPRYVEEIKRLITGLNLLKRVFITGFLGLNDLRYLLNRAEFVVLPAIYSIAGSGPLAQVFAHEKPVIVSDLGVYHEEIDEGVTGLLSKAGDDRDLGQKMELLLKNDQLRERISENVRAVHRERGWGRIAGRTVEVYQKIVEQK